jgi:hypothetical protein
MYQTACNTTLAAAGKPIAMRLSQLGGVASSIHAAFAGMGRESVYPYGFRGRPTQEVPRISPGATHQPQGRDDEGVIDTGFRLHSGNNAQTRTQ